MGCAMTEKKKRGPKPSGRPLSPMMGLRLSKQQRAIALQVAQNAGVRPTVAGGVHILIAQAASQLANT